MSNHYNVLQTVKSARGNNKQDCLRRADDTLKQILWFTYHPHKHYYLKKVPWGGKGTGKINEISWVILMGLSTRKLSGQEAKDVVKKYITGLKPEEAEIFKCILKKDLRIGMGAKSINKVFPDLIPEFSVMLASKFEKAMWRSGLYASVKLDGLRAYWDGENMYSRNGFEVEGIEHITKALPDIPLDGELLIPGKHFQVSSGKIRSLDSTPGAKYFIFDAPREIPFKYRYENMLELAGLHNWGNSLVDPKDINIVKHRVYKDFEDVERAFITVLSAGFEGLVLKSPSAPYQKKRSKAWMKMKNTLSEDLPCVGFFEGKGKYEGTLGGIIVERDNGVLVRVGSGFSDGGRDSIFKNQTKYTGLIAEIHYHEETPDGSLRHPIFKGWRIDK